MPVFGSLARDTLAIFALGAVGGIIFALLMGPGMSQGNMQLLNIELIEIIDQLLN